MENNQTLMEQWNILNNIHPIKVCCAIDYYGLDKDNRHIYFKILIDFKDLDVYF